MFENIITEQTINNKEDYLVMEKEDIESYIKFLIEKIEKWHKIQPDIVFSADSSAVPISFALKETWKRAYPNEKLPKFMRLDPKKAAWDQLILDLQKNDIFDEKLAQNLIKEKNKTEKDINLIRKQFYKIQSIKNKDKIKILAYDETSMNPFPSPTHIIKDGVVDVPEKERESLMGHSMESMLLFLMQMRFKNIWIDYGEPENYYKHIEENFEKPKYQRLVYKNQITPIKEPTDRKKAEEFLHDLKLIGEKAGEYIFKEE